MEIESRIFKINNWGVLKDWVWGCAIDVLNRAEELKLENKIIYIINSILETYERGIEGTTLNDYIGFDLVDDLDWNYDIKLYPDDEE